MLGALITLMRYEIINALRSKTSAMTPLLFFITVVCLFAFAITPQSSLAKMAPGIIWITALLATLLSLDKLFVEDASSGHIDRLLASPLPLTWIIFCKIVGHWCVYGIPLVIISPLLGFLLNLSTVAMAVLTLSLLLGTPILILWGAVGAALTVGIRQQSLLLPVLIMPLYIPTLIFGTGMVIAANSGQPLLGSMALLIALLCIGISIAPLLAALALKISMND